MMISIKPILSVMSAALLSACMTAPAIAPTPQVAPQTVAVEQSQTYLMGWGMFGDPVFDRDVITFERAFTRAYGAPAQVLAYGANERSLTRPNVDFIEASLSQMAGSARDGQDLVVVMLTSHGAPDVIALQTSQGGPVAPVSADQLAQFLSPLDDDRQILILQACYSGSLIDELRSPNRIIMTAAAADRTSFGCNPDSDNTWFIKSLNRAIGEGGSWQQIFARTQALVLSQEQAAGFPASNPQSFVGGNMREIWAQNAR